MKYTLNAICSFLSMTLCSKSQLNSFAAHQLLPAACVFVLVCSCGISNIIAARRCRFRVRDTLPVRIRPTIPNPIGMRSSSNNIIQKHWMRDVIVIYASNPLHSKLFIECNARQYKPILVSDAATTKESSECRDSISLSSLRHLIATISTKCNWGDPQ